MAIKGVLREELDNSVRMQKRYEEELERLPVGSLVRKKIKGHYVDRSQDDPFHFCPQTPDS